MRIWSFLPNFYQILLSSAIPPQRIEQFYFKPFEDLLKIISEHKMSYSVKLSEIESEFQELETPLSLPTFTPFQTFLLHWIVIRLQNSKSILGELRIRQIWLSRTTEGNWGQYAYLASPGICRFECFSGQGFKGKVRIILMDQKYQFIRSVNSRLFGEKFHF